MSIRIVALALGLFVLGHSTFARGSERPAQNDPWPNVTIVADAQGICNPKASENVFVQLDAKAWRNEFRVNCWWPAFEGRSRYLIKTYDWGSAPSGEIISSTDGQHRPPVEVWVQGLHLGDASIPYRRSLTLYRITCARGVNRYAMIEFIAYDARDRIVERWERRDAQPRAAIPNAKEEAITWAVCN